MAEEEAYNTGGTNTREQGHGTSTI
jgi:hypothetical protein